MNAEIFGWRAIGLFFGDDRQGDKKKNVSLCLKKEAIQFSFCLGGGEGIQCGTQAGDSVQNLEDYCDVGETLGSYAAKK